MVADLKAYARFAADLPRFLDTRIVAGQAAGLMAERLRTRDRRWLEVIRHGVFAQPGSPYRQLFAHAGCTMADVERLVARDGLDAALVALKRAGVRVSFEEFKGRQPIVRGSTTIEARPRAFDNPLTAAGVPAETSGSSGPPARVMIDLHHIAATTPIHALARQAHGLAEAPWAVWRSILPGASGLNNILRGVCLGRPPERWFSPVAPGDLKPSIRRWLATEYLLAAARWRGLRLPRPEHVPIAEARLVARWMGDILARDGRCLLSAFVSLAARVADAAVTLGIDLTGATFLGGGEPPSPAKVTAIARSGARFVPTYSFTEAGPVGMGCARPLDATDVHLCADTVAVIQDDDPASTTDMPPGGAGTLWFTSLLPTTPRLLLNVDSGDTGLLDTRTCGCALGDAGLTLHARQIGSRRKLTAEGVTVLAMDLARIVEEDLPRRLGGTAMEYQAQEEQHADARTRLVVRVSPSLGEVDEAAVVRTVLDGLGRGVPSADMARAIWAQDGTVIVRREEPRWTRQGKRPAVMVATALLALLVATACGTPPRRHGPARDRVVVAMLPYLSFAPIFIAHEEGFFAEAGLDVEFIRQTRSAEAIPALDRGDLDVAGGTLSLAMFNAVTRGSRIRLVADKGYVTRDGCAYSGLLVRRALAAEASADGAWLRGRRVAADRAAFTGYYLEKALASVGLTPDEVRPVIVPDEILAEAFDNGSLDVAHTAEPWITRLVHGGHATIWKAFRDVVPDSQYAYLMFGPGLLDRRPDVGRRFIAAYLRGVAGYREGKTPRNLDILAAHTGLDRALLEASCWPEFRATGAIDAASVLDFQRWGVAKGLLDAFVPPGDVVETRFLDQAVPAGAAEGSR